VRGIRLILAGLLVAAPLAAYADSDPFQNAIDTSVEEIMTTTLGKTICQHILGGDVDAIHVNLGVSTQAAQIIAQQCGSLAQPNHPWIYATNVDDIQKATLSSSKPRKYVMLSADNAFPIESWTDPFTNTTVLIAGPEGMPHQRLVQLLAHEMAVYFDSKANPAHPDAQNIPEIRNLNLPVSPLMNPLIAVTDPLVAHTLTFVRALQVEYQIVDELIQTGLISPPPDHNDPYLQFLVSEQCQKVCLESLIINMHSHYLPIGLPLLAFAPHFRSLIPLELARIQPHWSPDKWMSVQQVIGDLPVDFLKNQFTGNPLADIERVFLASTTPNDQFTTVAVFMSQDLWPLEEPSVVQTNLPNGRPFLEYMKVPLLSGYNILLSSGPRVRVGPGAVE
jgi:hypothetical protein